MTRPHWSNATTACLIALSLIACGPTLQPPINSATAVHELGHARETTRPDTPESRDKRQGSNGTATVGAWDLSIMNDCNLEWSNVGRLSASDIIGVRQLYHTGPLYIAAAVATVTI